MWQISFLNKCFLQNQLVTNFEEVIAKKRFSSFSTFWNFCPNIFPFLLGRCFSRRTGVSFSANVFSSLEVGCHTITILLLNCNLCWQVNMRQVLCLPSFTTFLQCLHLLWTWIWKSFFRHGKTRDDRRFLQNNLDNQKSSK